jgi:hypothetical protein
MPIIRRVVYAKLRGELEDQLRESNLARQRQGLPPEKPPSRTLYVETLEGHELVTHPVFQVAPLNDAFRDRLARERDLTVRSIRLERHGAPEALILQLPARFLAAWRGLPVPRRFEDSFTQICRVPPHWIDWIGMSRDRTWVWAGLPAPNPAKADVPALGLYVNLLCGLDETGAPPSTAPQGPIPDGDAEALSDLAP